MKRIPAAIILFSCLAGPAFGQTNVPTSTATNAATVTATNVAAADEQVSRGLDFALLDVNVGQDTTFALALRLRSYGVPFAFASGSSRAIVPDDLAGAPFLVKPCCSQLVISTVCAGLAKSKPVAHSHPNS